MGRQGFLRKGECHALDVFYSLIHNGLGEDIQGGCPIVRPGSRVLKESAQMVTQTEIARLTGFNVSTVNKILNKLPGFSFSQQTVRKVFSTAREVGYDLERLQRHQRRRHHRRQVSIRTSIWIYREDNSLHDQGKAMIYEISLGGAVIGNLSVHSLPVSRIRAILRPLEKPLKDLDLPCRFVRFPTTGDNGYGIEFERLKAMVKRKLNRVVLP